MALERGVLVVMPSKDGRPPAFKVRLGDNDYRFPPRQEMSQSLLDDLTSRDSQEVEFERVKKQPVKVREVGGKFIAPSAAAASPASRRERDLVASAAQPKQQQPAQKIADFHNPYNFVPALPREVPDPEFGDHPPPPQDTFEELRYTGRIRVRMVVKTPLLVPDVENKKEGSAGHQTYPLRMGLDGKPLIPASSVRGMLRSAYEAVTNSRFGCFSHHQHEDRLAFRMDARDGLSLIPARIAGDRIHLLTGTSTIGTDGRRKGPMYAAWLPRYDREGNDHAAMKYPSGALPSHRDEVVCWVEKIQHCNPGFVFWRVREIRRGTDIGQLGPKPEASLVQGKSEPAAPAEMKQIHGWVCVTNANIGGKHDERVFFGGVDQSKPCTASHRSLWEELVENYQSIHEEQVRKRRDKGEQPEQWLGHKPGQTAWSRHVYTEADRELSDGALCYVRLNAAKTDETDVEAIFPVMIARELYPASPWDLLDATLRPAVSIDQLSPADRVFGWVRGDVETKVDPGQQVAARGLLRVGPVTCESTEAESVEIFASPGVPLAILAAPKPQQGRFYVAKSKRGEAQCNGLTKKDAGYSSGKGLRGRKVYPHHAGLPAPHWANPTEDRTQSKRSDLPGAGAVPAYHQEYRRPIDSDRNERDEQNRSILGWVKPGASFTFDVHVHNLSQIELGALLWLLKLPEDHFLRLGTGKPLGFGSVRLAIDQDSIDVCTGQGLRSRYSGWLTPPSPGTPIDEMIKVFTDALLKAYPPQGGGGFDKIPFIAAFQTACCGFHDGLPTHYPRATRDGNPGPPNPAGESFNWFVANEQNGARHALSDLVNDPGLATLKEKRLQ